MLTEKQIKDPTHGKAKELPVITKTFTISKQCFLNRSQHKRML